MEDIEKSRLTLAYYIQHHTAVPHLPSDPPGRSAADSTPQPPKISRRQFGRDAARVTASSLGVAALLTSGAVGPGSDVEVRPESQEKKGDPLKGLTPQQVADVEAKHANLLRKHGHRFSDAQKTRLRRILAQHERLLAPVRAFAVQNGDPPASVLRVSFDRPGLAMKEGGKD